MVDDDIRTTGLQSLVDGWIEVRRRRAPGLDQVGVQVVVEQVQPQHIRRLRDFPHRYEVRRDGFDVLPARLVRQPTHAAERIVFEVGDFSRHEAVDPPLGTDDVGEAPGPVAITWVNVDDDGACIDACELDQLGKGGSVVHRNLLCDWASVTPRLALLEASRETTSGQTCAMPPSTARSIPVM